MNATDASWQTPDPGLRTPGTLRILVRGTNWLGDAVMTTPALMRLREKFPDAHITLLTPEKLRDLWTGHPAVNETISFAPDESVFAVARKLRGGRDIALRRPERRSTLAPPDLIWRWCSRIRRVRRIETWLAGIPRRVGYARPWRNFFLTQAVAPRPDAVKMQKRSVTEIRQLIAMSNLKI